MENTLCINGINIAIKEYSGQRVVTFKEIDQVHGRTDGNARKRFNENRKHFILGVDFFVVRRGENVMSALGTLEIPNRGLTLITETGYLMLVKSFTDDRAWQVQRELVRNYFRPDIRPQNTKMEPDEIFYKIQNSARAILELAELGENYDSEEYISPLRNSIFLLTVNISLNAHNLGKIL